MKAIILAAGMGTRIRSVTKDIPKCLVEISNETLLNRQIRILRSLKIKDIYVITGHKSSKIKSKFIRKIYNRKYKVSEQLESLFCAKKIINEEVLIIFGDIIYDKKIIIDILKSTLRDITIAVDTNFKKRYTDRIDHPFDQADKVSISRNNKLLDIGKKISLKKTNGEFLGIFTLTQEGFKKINKLYQSLFEQDLTKSMQIHNFLQIIIKNKIADISICKTFNNYMEIDTYNDMQIAKKIFKQQ